MSDNHNLGDFKDWLANKKERNAVLEQLKELTEKNNISLFVVKPKHNKTRKDIVKDIEKNNQGINYHKFIEQFMEQGGTASSLGFHKICVEVGKNKFWISRNLVSLD